MKIILFLIPFLLIGCGTISSQDYTEMAIENAVWRARAEATQDRHNFDRRLFEEWQRTEGRRAHKPGSI
jgi:hypothetical protein